MIMEEEADNFVIPKKRLQGRRPKLKKIKVSIKDHSSFGTDVRRQEAGKTEGTGLTVATALLSGHWWDEWDETSQEGWLDYFSETHEDQDPLFIEREEKRTKEAIDKEIALLDAKDKQGRDEIAKLVSELLRDQRNSVERSMSTHLEKTAQEETKHLNKLHALYKEKSADNQQKINQRVSLLRQEQQKQASMALQEHRQQAQQRRLLDHQVASEWQQRHQVIQVKHQQQRMELQKKADEYQRKTEMDYEREKDKIRKSFMQRKASIESRGSTMRSELVKKFTLLQQRFVKRHLQDVLKDKEDLLKAKAAKEKPSIEDRPVHEPVKSATENHDELRPPSPFRSAESWVQDSQYENSGAASRHKHRKGIMSQLGHQMTVEIHNEGIWILLQNSGKSTPSSGGGNESHDANSSKQEFIDWGTRAFSFLESIVSGEIPQSYHQANFGDSVAQHGGQIMCCVADLRTSEETASSQRAAALREQETATLRELENKASEYGTLASESEKAARKDQVEEQESSIAVDAAVKELDKAKKLRDDFNGRYKRFLGTDGMPLPTVSPKDRQDLTNKMVRLKNNITASQEKEKKARDKHAQAKVRSQQSQTALKTAQRNQTMWANLVKKRQSIQAASKAKGTRQGKQSDAVDAERAAMRVKDVVASLRRVAEKRRQQQSQKKSGSHSTKWIQSFANLSSSLKKSLWRKMHRRKVQIVLRPSTECLVNEIREKAREAPIAATGGGSGGKINQKREALEERVLKSEQLFLLGCHPVADELLPSIPSASGKPSEAWGEPGWHVDLSVPTQTRQPGALLPCRSSFPVLDKNLSEVASAPGRQAASFLHPSNFRTLMSPLSTFAVASSPAEVSTKLTPFVEYCEGDPLVETKTGYSFSLKAATPKTASQNRKKTSTAAASSTGTSKDYTDRKRSVKTETTTSEKPMTTTSDRPEKKRRTSKTSDSPRKRKKDTASTTSKQQHLETPASTPTTQGTAPTQPRKQPTTVHPPPPRNPHIQTHMPPATAQANSFPSPQMAQLRMMQARSGQLPPGYQPQAIQQMQQFYAPLTHPNGPSPRNGFRPSLPPNMRMQGRQGVGLPMHQGLPMPGAPSNVPMNRMGGQQPGPTNPALQQPPSAHPGASHVLQGSDASGKPRERSKDQTDSIFMMK